MLFFGPSFRNAIPRNGRVAIGFEIVTHQSIAVHEVEKHAAGITWRQKCISVNTDMIRCRELSLDVVIVELHFVITGLCYFTAVRKLALVSVIPFVGGFNTMIGRHQQDVAIVGHSCALQVCVRKAIDVFVVVVIAAATIPSFKASVG